MQVTLAHSSRCMPAWHLLRIYQYRFQPYTGYQQHSAWTPLDSRALSFRDQTLPKRAKRIDGSSVIRPVGGQAVGRSDKEAAFASDIS